MSEFEIKVTELDAGSREYDFPIRAAWLVEELRDLAPEDHAVADTDGALHVIAEKSGSDVVVRGDARATIYVPCGRCLAPARVECRSSLAVLMSRRADVIRTPDDDEDMSPEEQERELFTGDEISLDELVREHLVLEIPMQPLCRPDCPGIEIPATVKGPKFLETPAGAPDIDPRLAPLLALSKGTKASS